jgi:hypothetical protein
MGVRKVWQQLRRGRGAMHSGEADARRGIAGCGFAASRRRISDQAALADWVRSIAETERLVGGLGFQLPQQAA